MFEEFNAIIGSGQNLSELEARKCLSEIFEQKYTEDQIVSILNSLHQKGESISEILGFSKELLARCVPIHGLFDAIDTCGTGGSGMNRFNIGTTVAFVLASGGYPVAKHGNKGSKKPNGSFDLLEELGVNFDLSPEQEQEIFRKTKLVFLYARSHHPIMKMIGAARAKIKTQTIFNMIGPLCNPASVSYQIVGVSNASLGEKLIEVLKQFGRKRAIVVYGEPGIDEFSISGESVYWFLDEKGEVSNHRINVGIFGIQHHDFETMPGGEAKINKELFKKILDGENCDGLLDMVALNAGAAVFAMGKSGSIMDGYNTAMELIISGETKEFFEKYKNISNQYV